MEDERQQKEIDKNLRVAEFEKSLPKTVDQEEESAKMHYRENNVE